MDDIPPIVLTIAGVLTVVIHVALGYGVAYQAAKLLERLPAESRKLEPKLCYLLLIPLFSLIWIWIVMFRVTSSFTSEGRGESSLAKWPYIICISFCACFFLLDPNWAWVVVLLLFIQYRKTVVETFPESDATINHTSAEQVEDTKPDNVPS